MRAKSLNNWSLRRYTFVVTSAISLLFALIVCEGARQSSIRNYYENFEENAEILTSTIEAASNYDLKVENAFALKHIASRIVESVPDVVAIVINNEDGRVLAALNKHIIEQSHSIPSISNYEKDAFANGRMIGRIVVGFDVKHRKTVLRNSAIKIYLSGIAIVAVGAMLILAMLNHIVVGPIQRIHAHLLSLQNNQQPQALKIAANKELSHLASTVNEFGNVLELRKQKEDELEEISKAKSDFLANMSHELRTPMNGVLGMLSLLRATPLNPEQHDQIRIATNSSKGLLTLIDDILDFSKLEAGKVSYEKVQFELEDLIQECAESVSEAAYKKDIDIVCEMDKDLPTSAIGDPTRLRQVIMNLAGNAVKFTNEGLITISAIPVKNEHTPHSIKFIVSDTGVGISIDAQQKLFNSFEQADSSTTREFGGTGLGLAISRRLVEGMGGQIEVDSTPGEGSSFWIILDLPPANDRTVYNNRVKLERDLKVLLIEPIDSSRNNAASMLREQCAVVECATNGSDGLQAMSHAVQASEPHDIVLFSTMLKDMSAIEFTRSVQDHGEFADVNLIAINTITEVQTNLYTHTNNKIVTQLLKPIGRKGLATALSKSMQSSRDQQSSITADAAQHEPHVKASVSSDNNHIHTPELEEADDSNRCKYHNIQILVVEDNLVNQYITQSMIENMGFSCLVADNGQHALDTLETTKVDLILMDCQMPVLDGFKATEKIRATETDTRVPIIALTANAMRADEVKCLEAGMDGFLTKPIDEPVFERTILDTLEELINEQKSELLNNRKAA